MCTVKDAMERLSKYPPDEPVCMVLWLDDDVHSKAAESNLVVSDELAAEILEMLEDNHDANYGVTWDHIDAALDSNRQHEGLTSTSAS